MWYDYGKLRSHNALFNFIIGNRGGGKTYGFLKMCINDFIRKGEQFLYVRRYETEVKATRARLVDAVRQEFPEHEVVMKGKDIHVNGKIAGSILALSTAAKFKSVAYPKVTKMGFDEFIVDKSFIRYMTNEVDMFLELFKTVDRDEDRVTCFFMGNAISVVNPYFSYWDIKPSNKEFTKFRNGLILIHMYKDAEFIQRSKNTKFGSLISGTEYESYAVENEFFRDNESFIEEKSSKAQAVCTFYYKGQYYGVWNDYELGKMYLSRKCNRQLFTYALTTEDHEPNMFLCKKARLSFHLEQYVRMFEFGQVGFDSQKVKNAGFEIYQLLRK